MRALAVRYWLVKTKVATTSTKAAPLAGASIEARVAKLSSTAKAAKRAADLADKRRATALLSLVSRRKGEIVEAFYDIGEALRELSRKKLYRALGHRSFAAMLSERTIMSATQANKLIRIVESVPRDTALSLGAERAFALVSLTDATPEKDTVEQLVASGATRDGTPLRTASRRAIAAEAERTRKESRPPSKEDRARARAQRAAVASVRAALRALGVARPTIRAHDDGRVVIELSVADVAKLSAER